MDKQHDRAAQASIRDMQQACSMDTQHGEQHGYAVWICHMDVQRGNAAVACNMNMQHGNAAVACNMNMQHRHATFTCSIDGNHGQATWRLGHPALK
jgi:hypothetical protein